jgi:hypothetical protein
MKWLLAALVLLGIAGSARAQPGVAESEEHFQRGLRLWDQSDFKGALVQLRRSYELNPKPDILYNVAFVLVRLDDPVPAVEALDRILRDPGSLPAERVETARRTREEQASHIGQLLVRSNVDASLSLDGVLIGRTPMTAAVPVGRGRHWLTASAEGQSPFVDHFEIGGGQTLELPINLVPMQGTPAQLSITCPVPGADVLLDGRVVGRTPLSGSLPVAPGGHEVMLRRPGYQEARSSLVLAGGASQLLALAPAELTSAPAPTGLVGFSVSEPDATVEIDGRPRPDYRQGMRLPAGVHQLKVSRTGFFPVEREIVSETALINVVKVTLEPTEEVRVAQVERATSQRRWAWGTAVTGALVGGAATFLYLHNRSELRAADAEVDEVGAMRAPGGQCSAALEPTDRCVQLVQHANDRLDRAERTRQIALVGMGVGGAALITGLVLRIVSDDPHRYDFEPIRPEGGSPVRFLAGVQPGGASVGVQGRF